MQPDQLNDCPSNNTNDAANAFSTFANFSANLTLEQILLITRDEANSLDVKITAVQIILTVSP